MPYSAQGTKIQRGDGATPELFTTIGEVVSVSGPSLTHTMLDTSCLEDVAKTFLASGVVDGGEVTLEINFEADNAVHDAIVDDCIAGSESNYQICWPNLAAQNFAFIPADVNVGAETIAEVAHGLTTGQPVRVGTDDTLPAPLVAATTYYTIWVNANSIQLATTNALAVAGTAINLTTQGVGNHALYYGGRYDWAAAVSGAAPGGAMDDKLTCSLTFKVAGAVTPNP